MTFEAIGGAALRRGGRILSGLLGTATVVVLVPSAAVAAPQDLDPHFGGGTGKVTTDVGPYDSATSIGGGQGRRCTSPYRTRKLTTGRHRLKVMATDGAGNSGSATKHFRIKRRR